ncbi:MAG: ABC transporter permease [Alistipes finegoldii]
MRFFDTDRWNEIWQTISRNRKRSIMTALGVFWGIFMLIVLLGAGMGLGRLFRAQLGGMSTNTVLLQAAAPRSPTRACPRDAGGEWTTTIWKPSANSKRWSTPQASSGATNSTAATKSARATIR